MKYLAIDYGQKRTGIAASDSGGSMAFPRKTLTMTTKERFWTEFLALAAEEAPQAIVIGLPLQADGTEGLTARQVRNFIKSLRRRLDLPVYTMLETLSSFEAEDLLREQQEHGGKRPPKEALDSLAAARILESFLNQPEAQRVLA